MNRVYFSKYLGGTSQLLLGFGWWEKGPNGSFCVNYVKESNNRWRVTVYTIFFLIRKELKCGK